MLAFLKILCKSTGGLIRSYMKSIDKAEKPYDRKNMARQDQCRESR